MHTILPHTESQKTVNSMAVTSELSAAATRLCISVTEKHTTLKNGKIIHVWIWYWLSTRMQLRWLPTALTVSSPEEGRRTKT